MDAAVDRHRVFDLAVEDEAPERSGARRRPRLQAPSRPAPEQLLEILRRHRAQLHIFVLVILVRPGSGTEPRAGRLSPGTICAGSNGRRSLQRRGSTGGRSVRPASDPRRDRLRLGLGLHGRCRSALSAFGPRMAAPAVTTPTDRRTDPMSSSGVCQNAPTTATDIRRVQPAPRAKVMTRAELPEDGVQRDPHGQRRGADGGDMPGGKAERAPEPLLDERLDDVLVDLKRDDGKPGAGHDPQEDTPESAEDQADEDHGADDRGREEVGELGPSDRRQGHVRTRALRATPGRPRCDRVTRPGSRARSRAGSPGR